jgi:HNH/Endo VII superfamily nuclease toxin with a HHH motif
MNSRKQSTLPMRVLVCAVLGAAIISILMCVSLLWWDPLHLPDERHYGDVYRLAPGDYEITSTLVGDSGKTSRGQSILIPAARIAIGNAEFMLKLGWSGTDGITVERIEAGKAPEVRPFNEAVGLGSWLACNPVSERYIEVKVHTMTDFDKEVRYILHVPNDRPALISPSPTEVTEANQKIMNRPGAVKAMQRIDEYAARLRKAFGGESGLVGEFADHMRSVEDSWLQGSDEPGALVEKQIDAFVKSVTDQDAKESLYLLSVVHGNVLTGEQIAEARNIFGVPIANSYAAAAAVPRADGLMSLFTCLIADDLPDDFEGLVRMLLWVTEDVRGPFIIREWDVGNVHYIEYVTYYGRSEDLRRYVAGQFRIQNKDVKAATRLLNVIQEASKAGGPFSLLGEHLYNLNYILDMRDAPEKSDRTAEGYQRNSRWYWTKMLNQHGELFDEENRNKINQGLSPTVNKHWLNFFPMHQGYEQDKLIHHHIGRGPIATPIPQIAHEKKYKQHLHPQDSQ